MGKRKLVAVGLVLAGSLAGMTASGCNPAPVNVAARRLAAVPPGQIRRIAVMPFTQAGLISTKPPEPGQEPLPEPAAETVTRVMTEALRRRPEWQVTDPAVVEETFRRLYGEVRAPTLSEALAVGKALGVDAVLRGEVTEFEERIGTELAAKRPARVVFAVELTRIPSGEVVWQAEYAETQQALTENLWDLFGFLRAGAKWVRAGELAALGADQIADQMHTALGSAAKSSS